MQKRLDEAILSGEHVICDLIVPQEFEKVCLKDGKLVVEKISIEGRKIPLYDIRKSMLQNHKKYMRLTSDEEINNLTRDDIIDRLTRINEFKTVGRHRYKGTSK